jgi:hypothetical protein
MSTLLILLQAVVPTVHQAESNDSCIAGLPHHGVASPVTGDLAYQPDGASAPSGQPDHDPLHCLLCRSVSRIDGQATTPSSVGTINVPSASRLLSSDDSYVPSLVQIGSHSLRAPPALSA